MEALFALAVMAAGIVGLIYINKNNKSDVPDFAPAPPLESPRDEGPKSIHGLRPPGEGKMSVSLSTKPFTRARAGKWYSDTGYVQEYKVSLFIRLSEQQRAILTKHHLWDVQILTTTFWIPKDELELRPILRSESGTPMHLTIKHLLAAEGFHLNFPTPVDAKNFENTLRTETLPLLKKYIEQSHEAGKGSSDQFEL